jgi:hypothetical protein
MKSPCPRPCQHPSPHLPPHQHPRSDPPSPLHRLPSIDLPPSTSATPRPPPRSCRAQSRPAAGSHARHARTHTPPTAALWRQTWRRPPRSGGCLRWAEGRRWRRLWRRLSVVAMASSTMGEETGHQPSVILHQPGVPPKRRLLWTAAPVASSIDRPSLHRAGGRDSIASCCRIH